jgi:hypothetical protein
MPDKIEMITRTENVTRVTGVTSARETAPQNTVQLSTKNKSIFENTFENKDKNDEKSKLEVYDSGIKDPHPTPESVTGVTSVTKLDTDTENDNEECSNTHVIINLNYEKTVINRVLRYSKSAVPWNG